MAPEDLPDAELDVMAVLWHRGECTARQIRETLEPHRPMSQGAVLSLLSRLEEKRCALRTSHKIGKAYIYKARTRPAPTYRQKLNELLYRLFGGDRLTLVHSLFDASPPDDGEIRELEELLKQIKAKRSKGDS